MKKFLAISIAALLLASCAVQTGGNSGSLTLTAPRAVIADANGKAYTMRYSLRMDGEPVLFDSHKYLETTGSDTITIDNLVPGDGYTLSLSIGETSGKNLTVKYYGTTAAFSVASGTTTSVNLSLKDAPSYNFLTTSGGLSSVANVNGTKYVLDGTSLKSFSTDPTSLTTVLDSLSAYGTVNSLSAGKYFNSDYNAIDELWINTSRGIYRGTTGDNSLNSGANINVRFSKAAYVNNKIVAMYSGGTSLVGMKVAAMQSDLTGPWQTIKDSSDLQEYTADITKDVISGIGINNDNAGSFYYVSTAVGTVIGNATITSMDNLLAIKNDPNNPRWLKAGSEERPIKVVSSAGALVFAGTDSGVYSRTVDTATGIPVEVSGSRALSQITGTAGYKIVAIDSFKRTDGTVLTAAVTDRNDVLLFKNANLVLTLDAAIGIPESAKPLFWTGDAVQLALAGTNGAITVPFAQSQFTVLQ